MSHAGDYDPARPCHFAWSLRYNGRAMLLFILGLGLLALFACQEAAPGNVASPGHDTARAAGPDAYTTGLYPILGPRSDVVGQTSVNVPSTLVASNGALIQSMPVTSTVYLPLVIRRFPVYTVFGAEASAISEAQGLLAMVDAGVTWMRRAGIWWPDVEAIKGIRDWGVLSSMEEEFRKAASHNIRVVLVVRGTPAWAQLYHQCSCGPIRRDEFSAFAAFMQELVRRYSVPPYNIKYWEIGNEPDIAPDLVPPDSPYGCWGDQHDAYYGGGYYADMLKVVYPAIKEIDPQAQVLVGGLLLDCDPRNPPASKDCKPSKFLEGILRNGGGPYFNGVSFHAYDYYGGELGRYWNTNWHSTWNTTGPVLVAKARFLKEVMGTYGLSGKFLMNTESAILCDSCNENLNFETTKAYYVAQNYTAAMAEGLRANIWYSVLGWRNSGLLKADLSPRPAYMAYRFARSKLLDATFVREITEYGQVKGYEFNRGDRHIWVLWSLDGNQHPLTLPAMPIAAWDALGNTIAPSTAITVGLSPIYLEWQP